MLEIAGFCALSLLIWFVMSTSLSVRRQNSELREMRNLLQQRFSCFRPEDSIENVLASCINSVVSRYTLQASKNAENSGRTGLDSKPTFCLLVSLWVLSLKEKYPVINDQTVLKACLELQRNIYLADMDLLVALENDFLLEAEMLKGKAIAKRLITQKEVTEPMEELLEYLSLKPSDIDEDEANGIMNRAHRQLMDMLNSKFL